MSLLLAPDALAARGEVARGPLSGLAGGLLHELEPLIALPPSVPVEKALLTRAGGRCDRDGTLLTYDPFDERHRCPRCGGELRGAIHDRFRLYWHQLWLAERVLHAAVLGAVLDDERCRALAADLLSRYSAQYLHYPNVDNVLGPSRPFFSTYLESIWLLQLVLALDLLESGAPDARYRTLGARVRDTLVAPSAALIASYDEGESNRQVWNNAALVAAGTVLENEAMVDRALDGGSGLYVHLTQALLGDGSWYEGENYHLFAHRGLWYGVQMAERLGRTIPEAALARFAEGFAAPFRTVLPDLTYPSRRDSQYAVSVRQPRFAESCELGLARRDDDRLVGMLARLYAPDTPRGDTGRARTSADVELNVAPTGLTRADLSWRALLLARPILPPLRATPLSSDLLPDQGIGILRRESGALYAALDYGHSGGGHGHPDRLNVLLVRGLTRWFDDPGTGSYVDPTLHWYRSTLAHTAPLVDGRSQPRVHGRLLGFDERDGAGWVSAEARLADDLVVRRSLVLREGYLVDVVEWSGGSPHEIALPFHGIDLVSQDDQPLSWSAATIVGGAGVEDGFDFLAQTERVDPPSGVVHARSCRPGLQGWVDTGGSAEWWRALAPASPGGEGPVPLLLVRRTALDGRIVSVWSWNGAVVDVRSHTGSLLVTRVDGVVERHEAVDEGWRVTHGNAGGRTTLRRDSAQVRGRDSTLLTAAPAPRRHDLDLTSPRRTLPALLTLGEPEYRRSEESWTEAGRPCATVHLTRIEADRLSVQVQVARSSRTFISVDVENVLDNEPAAINGDGVQLYVAVGEQQGGWLLVPRPGSTSVGVRRIEGWTAPLELTATWRATAQGWELTATIALPPATDRVDVDVIVNETAPGRARRRGQLVLSGARGEFVYLRGDRHDRARLLRFTSADA